MKRNIRIKQFEKGQSTLEMIAIAPMLFGFIYMIFHYGIPVYLKLAAQNSAYSYAMGITRMPNPSLDLYWLVAADVIDNNPGLSTSNMETKINRNFDGQGFLTDLSYPNSTVSSQLVDTEVTSGFDDSLTWNLDKWIKGGAIAPRSPFLSCDGKDWAICQLDPGGGNKGWH